MVTPGKRHTPHIVHTRCRPQLPRHASLGHSWLSGAKAPPLPALQLAEHTAASLPAGRATSCSTATGRAWVSRSAQAGAAALLLPCLTCCFLCAAASAACKHSNRQSVRQQRTGWCGRTVLLPCLTCCSLNSSLSFCECTGHAKPLSCGAKRQAAAQHARVARARTSQQPAHVSSPPEYCGARSLDL